MYCEETNPIIGLRGLEPPSSSIQTKVETLNCRSFKRFAKHFILIKLERLRCIPSLTEWLKGLIERSKNICEK
uniref:Uncharacterized protein n=1 Tax=Glossina morsitans morsitans TaxID=37546 RepID=A0A1B0G0T0_GLOMM